jgi:hypothetical protein
MVQVDGRAISSQMCEGTAKDISALIRLATVDEALVQHIQQRPLWSLPDNVHTVSNHIRHRP